MTDFADRCADELIDYLKDQYCDEYEEQGPPMAEIIRRHASVNELCNMLVRAGCQVTGLVDHLRTEGDHRLENGLILDGLELVRDINALLDRIKQPTLAAGAG